MRLATTIRGFIPVVLLAVSAWAVSVPASAAEESKGRAGGEGSSQASVPCGDAAALVSAVSDAVNAGGGTVALTAGCTYTLTAPAVTPGTNGPDGLPVITGNVTITGLGATIRRSAAAADFRLVEVAQGGRLTLYGVTLENGKATDGGGILDLGTLSLVRTTVSGNTASGVGGGIEVGDGANATLNTSQVTGNTGGDGGGIHVSPGATLTVASGTISDNTATNTGGGIANWGTSVLAAVQVLTNRTVNFEGGGIWTSTGDFTFNGGRVNGNTAGTNGGGIANFGSSLKVQSTVVSGNTATLNGGGLFNHAGNAQLVGGVITGNTAHGGQGGGIFSDGGAVSLLATNVAGNNPNNCVPALAGCSG
ncbi:right-handed parallel beta-helix repeat-containing protein [Streptomyces botrytidirepellens]|uniref:Right-handed parallel beta-helix repeat-containing protein n=1 Tax=Streptomyces botrytidirepellens TaxID=2486417 RepID=A0A3M8W0K3_9ACTN|nr:right-handed parallel beta-helix repeat-containing protein [Streptomyces botrytidirepellens]RNG23120.1 right-handed parallel beta-helix repeat-containing protein [Streptomyces botrytidirepellens]